MGDVKAIEVVALSVIGAILFYELKQYFKPFSYMKEEYLRNKYRETFGFPPYDLSPEKIQDSLREHRKIQRRIQL